MKTEADLLAEMLASVTGRYEVREQVGAGGMALVFKARDRASGDTVALKVIRPQLLTDPHALQLFEREAAVSAKLKHRNIVRVREVLSLAPSGQAIVMDFLSGVSLKDHLRAKGPLSFERCVAILTDLAAAVEYTHFGGLVHRDIKPENVFLDPKTGQALLTDFGIACAIGAPVTDLEDSTHGTPSYMSPEHIEGRPLDARSDIYSMGCVAYEMLTGTPPWAGMTIGEVLERQRRDRLPPVHLVRRDIPAWLEGVVAQAVAKDPNGRFPDAKSFSEALAHNVTVQSQVAVNPRPRQLIGAAVSIVGAVALFLAGQSGSSTTAGPDLTPRETFVQSTLLPQSASRGRLPSLESGAEPSRPRPEAAAQELRPRAEPAAQFLPEPEVFPDNGFAEGLLAQAARLDGQPEGFGLIGDLEGLSRNSQVSQPLRAQARAQAVKFRRQCEALQALGAATCP